MTKKSLASMLKGSGAKIPKRSKEPVWKGPEDDGENGGITFSMLTKFLTCRERFRVRYIEGLKPGPKFKHTIEYGNLWHSCEEAFAANKDWKASLLACAKEMLVKFRTEQQQVQHWYEVCKLQFPIYVNWWKKHPDIKDRKPLLQEEVFHIPYVLPSGRTVYLRGKWDSVDLVTKGSNAGIWLMENKTKGDVEELDVERQLTFDLQTMLYIVALEAHKETYMQDAPPDPGYALEWDNPIAGVRYNVIRRPLAGGKFSIRKKEGTKNKSGESEEEFYQRLSDVIADAHGGTEAGQEAGLKKDEHHFFKRWNVKLTQHDIDVFKNQCLNPILESLAIWYDWVTTGNPWRLETKPDFSPGSGFGDWDKDDIRVPNAIHWRHPFGSVNTIDEYGAGDADEYINTGSEVGLVYSTELFEELKS